jgi:cytochrome P450
LGFLSPVLEAFVKVNVVRAFPVLHSVPRLIRTQTLDEQIQSALEDPKKLTSASHPFIYHQLLKPSNIPRLGHQDLMHEADTMLFAGSETAANAFTVSIFHLLSNADVHQRLFAELKSVWPILATGPPAYEIIEKLPYLVCDIPCTLLRMITHVF